MSRLKSAFVPGYLLYLCAVTFYAALEWLRNMEPALSWFGLLLAASGPLSFFIWIAIAKPRLIERHPLGFSIISGLGLAMTMAMSWRFGDAAGLAHIWAGICLLGWLAYLRWYSAFQAPPPALLEIGNHLPAFKLVSSTGIVVSSDTFTGKPHILIFFRGNWCPFCHAQIREMAKNYREIERLGASVIMISSQPAEKNKELAGRFDVPMQFMTDPDNQAASALGILDRDGAPLGLQLMGYESDTARPTVLVLNANGNIIYTDFTDNYRIRPLPDDFLGLIRQI